MPLAIFQYSADMPNATTLDLQTFPIFEQFDELFDPHEGMMSLMFRENYMPVEICLFHGSNREGLNYDSEGATRPNF
jgi:hypothetical protein